MSDLEEKKAIPCKVVLIGESGVGKTSIISRYMTDTFSTTLGSTPGANFTTKTVFLKNENQSIKFEIWDTAGQEKFRSLTKVFYKSAAICILVYEITRRESFEELKKYWISEIKNNSPKNISKLIKLNLYLLSIVLAIAANKSDMYEFEEVPEEEGMALAKQINAIFQSTTAKDKNGSIDQLFMNLAIKFLHPNMENTTNLTKEEIKNRGQKLTNKNVEKSKKGCC